MNSDSIREFNFPCDVPDVSWWTNTKKPQFRTVEVIGYKVLEVDSINFTNEKGQVINTARQVGTDNQNALSIRNSFLNEGIDPKFIPPIVLETGELLDGFTRHSVLVELDQEKFVYLVVKLRENFDIEDARDEVGLGCNNHPQSKRHTIRDFKTRLKRWIKNKESNSDIKVTDEDCFSWFDNINHSFNETQIQKAVDDVINDKLSSATTESVANIEKAKERGAKLLGIEYVGDVAAFDNSSGASIELCLSDIIKQYEKETRHPNVIGFLKKTPAEKIPAERKRMVNKINKLNAGLRLLAKDYNAAEKRGEGDTYEFIRFKGFLPQIIDEETESRLY